MNALKRLLPVVPACCSALIVAMAPAGVRANEPAPDKGQESAAPQIRSMGDFTDADPNHWAYDGIDQLIQTYQCVAGYPDGTFRGERQATRYEVAGLIQFCLARHLEKDLHDKAHFHLPDHPHTPKPHTHNGPVGPGTPLWLIAITALNSVVLMATLWGLWRERSRS